MAKRIVTQCGLCYRTEGLHVKYLIVRSPAEIEYTTYVTQIIRSNRNGILIVCNISKECIFTESKLGLLQYSDARQRKGLLMAPLSPRDVTSCHVEFFTFSRQCSEHCLFILNSWVCSIEKLLACGIQK